MSDNSTGVWIIHLDDLEVLPKIEGWEVKDEDEGAYIHPQTGEKHDVVTIHYTDGEEARAVLQRT